MQSSSLHLLGLLAIICATPASAEDALEDEFAPAGVDWSQWCPCLINMSEAPITFLPDAGRAGDHFVRIVVDDDSLGGNVCRRGAPFYECGRPAPAIGIAATGSQATERPETPEPLGRSFMDETTPAGLAASPIPDVFCTEKVQRRAVAAGEEGECIQRQELQLQKQFLHAADQPYLYSFRFRVPTMVTDTKRSIRWVTAQWKQEPVAEAYATEFGPDWGPSPFLAQRFDNGVLHVTVQDEHCRCMVASAPLVDGTRKPWVDGTPQYCESTRPGDPEGQVCTPDLKVEYGPDPTLSSPVGNWVELSYRVQAGRSSPAVIEVHEANRMIVRVTGKIGYEPQPGETSQTKFKIGHYRDYMPSVDEMDIDWIRRELAAP